jgi:hypothetical protein
MTGSDRRSSVWEILTTVSSFLVVLTGIGAIWFANSQIEESREDARRQIEEARGEARIVHLQEMIKQFSEPPVSVAMRSFALKRIDQKREVLRPLDPDDPPDGMYDLLNFFETVGLLTNRGYLDKKDVWEEFGYWLFNFYADARPVVVEEQRDNKTMYANLSWLMSEMERLEADQGGNLDRPSPDDLYSFYVGEAAAPPGSPISQATKRKR